LIALVAEKSKIWQEKAFFEKNEERLTVETTHGGEDIVLPEAREEGWEKFYQSTWCSQ